MQKRGIMPFCTAAILCLTVLLYNTLDFINIISPSGENIGETVVSFFDDTLILNKESENKTEEKPAETSSESTVSEVTDEASSSAVEASAAAVKGKIISQYVSPYTAASYNGAYVKNSTGTGVDFKSLIESNLGFKIAKSDEPQVLIMHTHTTESYMSADSEYYTEDYTSRSTDNSKNMVKIGSIVSQKLNSAGIKTLHAENQHDYPKYSGSYGRSAATVKEYLQKYPSIKIVLDIHRDAISSGNSDKVKLVTEIEGKKAAQVMLVMGSQTGSVSGYPNWKENLKLALKLQQLMEKEYPTLARPLSLVSSKYNQNLTTGSLLLEFGTDANSLDEACYSAELVGNALVKLLNN